MSSPYEIRKKLQRLGEQIRELKKTLTEMIDTTGDPEHPLVEAETQISSLSQNVINEVPQRPKDVIYIASLDSSSRYLRDPSINTVLVGLGIYSTRRGIITGPFDIKTNFMAIGTFENILKEMKPEDGVRVKNYVDKYFTEDYKIDDIADEMRLENENLGLKELKDSHDLIVVDGPLYPAPLELKDLELTSEGRKRHQEAYLKLVQDRINLLNENVLGVVKRLESSYKLCKESKIRDMLKLKYSLNDAEVLNQLRTKFHIKNALIGPFKLEFSSQYFEAPKRYAYYLILTNALGMSSYFRIEALSLEALENYIPYVVNRVSDRLIPTYIEIADNLSKRVSASLLITAYQILGSVISILHDDKLNYYNAYQQFIASLSSQRHL